MYLAIDIRDTILDYLSDMKDKVKFCYMNKENSMYLKIKTLLHPNINFTKSFLKQPIFSELVELDISGNECIDNINYLRNLKKLICRGEDCILNQEGISRLKLEELYCEGNVHIYDVGHMKDTLKYLESNKNIRNGVYKDLPFNNITRHNILCTAITFLICFIIFLSIWFGIYFGLISGEVYKNTQYIETNAKVDNITTMPYTCCNLICNTCTNCNSTNLPSCSILTANNTAGNCCNGYKCCKTCYKTCCHKRPGKGGGKTCYSCNPYCCSSIENSECYNNCGTCYNVNVYYYYETNNNKTVNVIEKFNCGMNDLGCLQNINASYDSNFTIYYDPNNEITITRTIGYTPGKFVGLGIISMCLIIICPLIVLYFMSYVFLVRKYKKFVETRNLMKNVLSI